VNLLALPLLPARLAVRALDDVHTLAVVAKDVGSRLDTLERSLDEILRLGRAIETTGGEMLRMANVMDERAGAVLALGERIDVRADAIIGMGTRLDDRGAAIVAEGHQIRAAAGDVTATAAQILEALPLLERALAMAQPLEGAVERLGRVADRLPGGKPRRP
jgi:hypothetical protein